MTPIRTPSIIGFHVHSRFIPDCYTVVCIALDDCLSVYRKGGKEGKVEDYVSGKEWAVRLEIILQINLYWDFFLRILLSLSQYPLIYKKIKK